MIAAFAVLLLAASPQTSVGVTAYPLDCTYVARGGELEPHGPCARIEDDTPHIDPAHLARMAFEDGLAEVRIGAAGIAGEIAYVRRDGRAANVFILDNGADYFKDGLVRGLRHGKLTYYDRDLRPVIVTGMTGDLRSTMVAPKSVPAAGTNCSTPTIMRWSAGAGR